MMSRNTGLFTMMFSEQSHFLSFWIQKWRKEIL